ncbi:MAG: hypothetical protein F4087_02255 [Gemmatimonadetes bacterium]|nr:hypothetical protein [Gemmatimonadota bacterium]MYE70168.1 hypothetical protein [Gemmatimonadota bacterium]MYJ67322.1 hypothetical protein [Gemmatimonadota bacterium]
MTTRPGATVLVLCAFACQPDEQDALTPQIETRDSAGIRIIENPRPLEGSRLPWRIGPEPTVSIGERTGEEPYMLYLPSSFFRFPDGRIVVANRGTEEVRVFDSRGTHLATWGGEGDGPAEFETLGDVEPWPGDSILAWDFGDYAISIFDADGNYGRSFFLQSGADPPRWGPSPVAARADGTILSIDDLGFGDSALVQVWDAEGDVLPSPGVLPDEEVRTARAPDGSTEQVGVAYTRELLTAVWGDLVVASLNKPYEIRAFRADGALACIVRLEHERRAPTEADRQTYVEGRMAERRGAVDASTGEPIPDGLLALMREFFESIPVAEHFPAFSAILADDTGHLWVREYDYPQEERPAPLWTVFDPAGRVLGYVETPRGLLIGQIGEDYILGRAEDELGVEYVQLWPLARSEAEQGQRP